MPTFIPYKPDLKIKATQNRKNPTKPESIMWYQLLARHKTGYKFMRQKPIDSFIVDFYCPELKLVIEIDGDTHAEQIEYDLKRNNILNNFGLKIIRYTNPEIMNNLQGVQQDLIQKIKLRLIKTGESLEVVHPPAPSRGF